MAEVWETDWLASRPVFYNEKTGAASHHINDVIDFGSVEIDPEGLFNFLDFGYSVLGQTPVRNVRFLAPCSRLTRGQNGHFEITSTHDPVQDWLGKESDEYDVLVRLKDTIQGWELQSKGPIVIPTSGGYDSRLLNTMINDRSRIRSFTYGLSEKQDESFEAVKAKKLSTILGTQCQQIQLGSFHKYFGAWDDLFGVSTHAHGMYHLEFYSAIKNIIPAGGALLSGIIGDAWAGSVEISLITQPDDLGLLGYAHGLRGDPGASLLKAGKAQREEYFARNKDLLNDPLYRVVAAMRFKIVLLNYLLAVPESLGFAPWSPFLIPEIALSMLTLPSSRRKGRVWQQDYFNRQGVNLESMNLPCNPTNTLDLHAMRCVPLRPLNVRLLCEVIKPSYVDWVNRQVKRVSPSWEWVWRQAAMRPRKVGRCCALLGIRDERLAAYSAYLTLKPIERVLERRDMAGKGGAS